MDQKIKRKAKRMLTDALKELAFSVESEDAEQNPLTKAQVLAKKVWDYALGTHQVINRKTNKLETAKGPEPWAIHLIFERLEGKVPILAEGDADRATAADKIGELSQARINKIADEVADGDDTK